MSSAISLIFKPPQLSQFEDHTPAVPSHVPPAVSPHAAELARRKGRVANPFFNERMPTPQQKKVSPKKVSNSLSASLDEESQFTVADPAPKNFTVSPKNVSNDFAAISILGDDPAPQAKPAEVIKLEPPTIQSDFYEITGLEQEQAFQAEQNVPTKIETKVSPTIEPKSSPKMSFQSQAGPMLAQLMSKKQVLDVTPRAPKFAAKVAPTQIQQDRFFQIKPQPAAVNPNQTRVVPPSSMAQALLKPVHQLARRTPPANPQANASASTANTPTSLGAKVKRLLQPQKPAIPTPSVVAARQPATVPTANVNAQANVNTQANAVAQSNPVGKPAVGLKGKCPVSLLREGKWV